MKTFKHYASCLFAAAFLITGCQNSNSTSATAETTTEADSLAIGKDTGNPVIRTIMERRSIRKYKPESVPREMMDIILRCGINAPSAMNGQPWEVRVVDNPEFIDGVTKLFVESAKDDERMLKMVQDPGFKNMFRNAPAVIFIAGKDGEGRGINEGNKKQLCAKLIAQGCCFILLHSADCAGTGLARGSNPNQKTLDHSHARVVHFEWCPRLRRRPMPSRL